MIVTEKKSRLQTISWAVFPELSLDFE